MSQLDEKLKTNYDDLNELANDLKQQKKKCQLIFAHNGTGKTRLSMAFKDIAKQNNNRDTLYFNAFTEDLFYWDNDLDNDVERVLLLNSKSAFFSGIWEMELDTRIKGYLHKYVNFDFKTNKKTLENGIERWEVRFFYSDNQDENIKISRGEEHLFIWCFFLAILQLSLDKEEGSPYDWVKYVYIDDPISSLDDNYAVSVAHNLAAMIKNYKKVDHNINKDIKFIISTHHGLFFNVLCNEFNKAPRYLLSKNTQHKYDVQELSGDNVNLYHTAMLKELKRIIDNKEPLHTYHFNILRNIMEKTANFHGLAGFKKCLEMEDTEFYERLIPVLNHGAYSVFEPIMMVPNNRENFLNILKLLLETYPFHSDLKPNIFQETSNDPTRT